MTDPTLPTAPEPADPVLRRSGLDPKQLAAFKAAAYKQMQAASHHDERTVAIYGYRLCEEVERQQKIAEVWRDVAKLAFQRLTPADRDVMLGQFKNECMTLDSEAGRKIADLFGLWTAKELSAPKRSFWKRLLPWRR